VWVNKLKTLQFRISIHRVIDSKLIRKFLIRIK